MWRFLLGAFLVAHGLIHASYASPRPPEGPVQWPFEIGHSWLLSNIGLGSPAVRSLGTFLWLGATLLFVFAGLGVFGVPGLADAWRSLAVAGAVASSLLLVLYWHPMLVLGVVLDVIIFLSLVWARWPSAEVAGS